MKHSIFLLSVFFLNTFLVHQNSYSQFRQKGDIVITFPTQEEVGDTVTFSRIRIAGHLKESGKIWINGKKKKVFPSLAFVDLVQLDEGDNQIEIIGETPSSRDTLIIPIFRIPLKPQLPKEPTVVLDDLVLPNQDVEFFEPSELRLRFRGSPGGKAEAKIPGIENHIPMVELRPSRASGLNGVYESVFRISNVKKWISKNVEFQLKGEDGKTRKLKTKTKVTIYPPKNYVMAETIGREVLIYSQPNGSILLSLPPGIKLNLTNRIGNYCRVKLASDLFGFIRTTNLMFLQPGSSPLQAGVGNIKIWENSEWLHLDISIDSKCPFQVEQSLDPRKLVLTIFNAAQKSEWMTYPVENQSVKIVKWHQATSDKYELDVNLNQDHWGYKTEYLEQSLRFSIRKEPIFADNPFDSLTIAVDAGHGGDELGAVGATGLFEKDVNLKYATYLCELLKKAGANVLLTREVDTTLSLRSRIEKAEKNNVHIFVWCHNNSIGATTNPLRVRGTSTYFTHPMGKRLADLTLPHLLKLGLRNFGEIQRTYYVTRQTSMLIFLVEGAFLSNPEDEMLLMDDQFLSKLARAVFWGIEDFLTEKKNQKKL